jgi:hypothetical protein
MSDADALEHEIEASRGRLGRTLHSLTQRLTPTGIVEDMLRSIRHDATGAVLYDGALEAVRRNPVPVLMMCLGTVMLLKGKNPIGGLPTEPYGIRIGSPYRALPLPRSLQLRHRKIPGDRDNDSPRRRNGQRRK